MERITIAKDNNNKWSQNQTDLPFFLCMLFCAGRPDRFSNYHSGQKLGGGAYSVLVSSYFGYWTIAIMQDLEILGSLFVVWTFVRTPVGSPEKYKNFTLPNVGPLAWTPRHIAPVELSVGKLSRFLIIFEIIGFIMWHTWCKKHNRLETGILSCIHMNIS